MKIYVSHSRLFDYKSDLYEPLKNSILNGTHQFILPHDISQESYPSKKLFTDKGCDLILAEVSFPSTGQGIELGWANILGVKIVGVYKKGSKISSSLNEVTKDFIVYENREELVNKLQQYLNL